MFGEPPSQRRQALGLDAIDSSPAVKGCVNQVSGLQKFQMLDDARAGDRQAAGKLAGGPRLARKTLKDDHPNRVTEQREYAQYPSELCRLGMRLGHELSGQTNTFDTPDRVCSTRPAGDGDGGGR
jgi:hypothetical protein